MISLGAAARLKNLDAEITHIKKYIYKNNKNIKGTLMQIWKSANISIFTWILFVEDFRLKHALLFRDTHTIRYVKSLKNLQTSRANNSRILRMKNANISGYCFYMNTSILADFQICIRAPLIDTWYWQFLHKLGECLPYRCHCHCTIFIK